MKNSNLSTFGIAMTYAGCYLGAGYVSGQELWQYFGKFGNFGFIGLLIDMILFFALGYILFLLCKKTNIYSMDKVIVMNDKNIFIRKAVSLIQILQLISVYILMTAGVAALFDKIFGISKYLSAFVFCFIISILALSGIKGLIKIFTFTVPALVIFSVIVSVVSVFDNSGFFSFKTVEIENSYGWITALFVYLSFNFFGAIGIMAPVYKLTDNKKKISKGIFFGTAILTVIAFSLIFSMMKHPKSTVFELPMLEISFSINKLFGFIYAVLLFIAMTGTSLSCLIATDNYLFENYKFYFKKRKLLLLIISVICFAGSLFGFSDLIAIIFPAFGVFGITAIIMIVINYANVKNRSDI